MLDKKTFCSSPWFHMRINSQGYYEFCRWTFKDSKYRDQTPHICDVDPETYFKDHMAPIRMSMLNGERIPECSDCYKMDEHNKVSGRLSQLLKVGVLNNHFEKSLASSPWANEFKYSLENNGDTTQLPVDWQVDLGNFCNSACIFCHPTSSSKLASEWKKIGLIQNLPPNAWCNNEEYLSKFIELLVKTPGLRYIHFIGGETLITPAYERILQALVDANKTDLSIGFTTNLTVWDNSIIDLMSKFESVNVGLSIETFHPVNDYVRWPSKIDQVRETLDRWVEVSNKHNWLMQIRITPTIFTVMYLSSLYQYALENNIAIQSCNFLTEPEYMRPSLLPEEMRDQAISNLQLLLSNQEVNNIDTIVNARNPNTIPAQLVQDAQSYINYLTNEVYEPEYIPELVKYLKKIEGSRNNSILDYLPNYEEFLRNNGY